jgi:hypothetical protein
MPRRAEAVQEIQTPEPESEKVIAFIRDYCFVPDGPNRGQPAMLSLRQGAVAKPLVSKLMRNIGLGVFSSRYLPRKCRWEACGKILCRPRPQAQNSARAGTCTTYDI